MNEDVQALEQAVAMAKLFRMAVLSIASANDENTGVREAALRLCGAYRDVENYTARLVYIIRRDNPEIPF